MPMGKLPLRFKMYLARAPFLPPTNVVSLMQRHEMAPTLCFVTGLSCSSPECCPWSRVCHARHWYAPRASSDISTHISYVASPGIQNGAKVHVR